MRLYFVLQFAIFGSCVSWVVAAFIFDAFNSNGIRGGMKRIFGSNGVWVCDSSCCSVINIWPVSLSLCGCV